jgi:glucosamine-6-phosphate deaminase
VAETCKTDTISAARNIHAFCMDEWADEGRERAPITYGASLVRRLPGSFYMSFRPDLRPPIEQMHYYTK